jgi:glyoxylase-like metal-dependent hydrolase (beta-lactamase superfamily II)
MLIRAFFVLCLLVCTLFTIGVVGIRSLRGRVDTPSLLEPHIAQVRLGFVWSYAASIGPHVILFDTGPDPLGQGVMKMIQMLGHNTKDVKMIFFTHGHMDHTAAAHLFSDAHLWMGEQDSALAAGKIWPSSWVSAVFHFIAQPLPVHPNHLFYTEEVVVVGDKKVVRAIPLSGHTDGSFAYLYDEVLFVGDAFGYDGKHLVPTPNLFNPHPKENRLSIMKLHKLLRQSPLQRICTGHGGCTRAGEAHAQFDIFVAQMQREGEYESL